MKLSMVLFSMATVIFVFNSNLIWAIEPCGAKSQQTGKVYRVKKRTFNIRSGPGTKFPRILNEKASRGLKKKIYAIIDNSTTVREICTQGRWSRIDLVTPEWLAKSHMGWVASRFLRRVKMEKTGVQVLTEDDFIWDKNISRYKRTIIKMVNKIARENRRCKTIDPSSAYISSLRSKPGNPIFFVTCNSGRGAFNVYFSKRGMERN